MQGRTHLNEVHALLCCSNHCSYLNCKENAIANRTVWAEIALNKLIFNARIWAFPEGLDCIQG